MRGYQKKVIYLKNTGSSIFEEAYFIIRSDKKESTGKTYTCDELIEEANRIIEENSTLQRDKKRKIPTVANTVIFAIGFLSAALLSVTFFIIL